MPRPKRSNIGRRTRNANSVRALQRRSQRTSIACNSLPRSPERPLMIEISVELIEIKDEEEDHRSESTGTSTNRKIDDNTKPCSKIEKIHHPQQTIEPFEKNDSLEVEVPESAPSPAHYSEDSPEAQLPSCVESYKDALRLLKALGDFALMEENYRAIGLFTQLEKIFETGRKAAEMGSSAKENAK